MTAYRDLVADELDVGPRTLVSVDVEDWYHEVAGGEDAFRAGRLPSNLVRNVERLLDLFAERSVRATFFVLGTAVDRLGPQLRRMVDEGHEVGSHGHAHLRLTTATPAAARADVVRAKTAIEDATGVAVRGFRAPYFSVTERSLWVLDVLAESGHVYDSSVCPVQNFAYGIPTAPERPHRLANGLVEVPLPQATVLGRRLMVGGGFYLRAYPFWLTQLLLRRRDPTLPRVFYIHPWEWDDRRLNVWDAAPDLPALRDYPRILKPITTFNRRAALPRFERLLSAWQGGRPIGEVVAA